MKNLKIHYPDYCRPKYTINNRVEVPVIVIHHVSETGMSAIAVGHGTKGLVSELDIPSKILISARDIILIGYYN